ncbi:MAG TPA: alkaline phosphatase family protein, partial [Verrucomicrobiae bacterium]|nr:alkaline phosphatase family protein [Verrucomicrobiae bacterium]
MNKPNYYKMRTIAMTVASAALLSFTSPEARATVSFLGVAAGDVSSTDVTLWTRATDDAAPGLSVTVTLQIASDSAFNTILASMPVSTTDAATGDNTLKVTVVNLQPATRYYYRFQGTGGELSNGGTFKTAPSANASVPVHFAFSGDMDGLMRPYALAGTLPAQNLDFYLNCGDVIYETASASLGNNGASWLTSPAVTVSGASASLNGSPDAGTTYATHVQLFGDYSRKYREQFLPVNTGGQNGLQSFYAGQANYTLYDNHELGNRQYINGGAPAGGSVGGPNGTDMPTGRGVDARNNGSGNVGNVNDANTSASDYMNRAQGFLTLQQVFLNYQPVKDRGTISAGTDPRTDGTKQLYFAQQWGRNAIYVHLDDRSYRDIRIKTANGGADDTGARADNPARSYLGATQLAWLEQTLLAAEQNGTPWKFVALSDPIDQIGPAGGTLPGVTATTMQPYSGNAAYGPVSSDGGKAFVGGYRAERNALLKFIADHQIKNVVFLATDDHQNRINEVLYAPSGRTGPGSTGFSQSDYVKVPYCFSIVCGPLGATGPDLFLNHNWSSVQGAANLIANAQVSAGVEPIGLLGYPGLHDVKREQDGALIAETTPQYADFYSPDTFNYNTLDVSADGKTLTVTSWGINSTAQNSALEYNPAANPAREIFSFQVDAASPLNNIDHFIVVYQENWSFDALYGSFPGANGLANASPASLNQIDRLTGNSLSSASPGNLFNIATRTTPTLQAIYPQPIDTVNGNIIDTRFPVTFDTLVPYSLTDPALNLQPSDKTGDIVHKYWQEQFQISGALVNGTDAGNNSGFVTWSDNPGLVMSRFDASVLPEGLLAQQYTMCDNFFHSAFGGSFLNHQFLIAAAPPVYPSMPASNNGNIGYLDATGLFAVNASGSSSGKVIRDGSITPLAGDVLSGLTINGISGQTATVSASGTPSDVAFGTSFHFDKHYVVNTTFSQNLCPTFSAFPSVALMPSLNNIKPSGAEYVQNIGDLLDNAGVSWKWYSGGWSNALDSSKSNPLHLGSVGPNTVDPLFQWHHQAFAYFEKSKPFDATQPDGRNPYATAHVQDEANLYLDISNSTLPSVAFVKFLGPDNEHPGYASLQQGQQHVANLVAAVQSNPALWARTAIIITYDEHGGRWDHVTPPTRDIWGPGLRVPAIVISPFARQSYVDHRQRDTSSVLSTIEQRFGLPALNQRDASAATFSDVLTDIQITRGGDVLNRRLNKISELVTVFNNSSVPIVGPINLVLDNLSGNTSLSNSAGTTANNAPLGSSYVTV